MKYFLILFSLLITVFSIKAQDLSGQWNGVLKKQELQLELVLNVSETENGFSATMDSPDQGKKDIPVTKVVFKNSEITFEVKDLGLQFRGELHEDEIVGIFKQDGQEFPMRFSRKVLDEELVKRPQEPVKPYPYYSEDVSFYNKEAKITLAGTLTLPKDKIDFPLVILISGSSPHNRNQEVEGHKSFLVLSDHLTKNGIGVFRYDDRGVGQSEGKYEPVGYADRSSDVESAIAYLKTREEINSNQIGLLGHSEGGLIAPIVASKSEDIDFIILMAAPGISGYNMILLQTELMNKAKGVDEVASQKELAFLKSSFDIVIGGGSNVEKTKSTLADSLKNQLRTSPERLPEGMTAKDVDNIVGTFTAPWFQRLLKYDPASALENVECDVLAINGGKDLQIPPKENLEAIKTALLKGGNERITIRELPNLNHLLQEATTGLPNEYSTIEQTISPIALEEITSWIKTERK